MAVYDSLEMRLPEGDPALEQARRTILERLDGTVMTNSGKWAHYAPSNIGVQVGFGSMEECVASAAAGCIVRLGR